MSGQLSAATRSITRASSCASAFLIQHFKNQDLDFEKDLLDLEIDRILNITAASKMATNDTPTTKMAGNTLQLPKPDLFRTTSSTSLDTTISSTSLASELSTTSTAQTTPHHSRAGSKAQDCKPTGLNAAAEAHLCDELKAHLDLETKKVEGTGLPIPRNDSPSEMPATKKNARDPWTLSYPAPTSDVDVAACLAKKKIYGTPYERLQEARGRMSREEREEYDSKQRSDASERMRSWEHQMFEDTMRNLKRKFGYAAAFNKDEKIKRPQTFMNGMGYWEVWDTKESGYKVIPGQTEKFKEKPPKSEWVEEEKKRREKDVEEMLKQ